MYVKFAGAAVACLRRWLSAENIPSDEKMEAQFLDNIYRCVCECLCVCMCVCVCVCVCCVCVCMCVCACMCACACVFLS